MAPEDIVAALSALAHSNRLAAFRLLVEAGPKGLAAGLVAGNLGIPPSSLTFHLQQLLHAHLITQRRASRQLIYAANFGTMNGLLAYLTKNCCGESERGTCATPVCNPKAAKRSAKRVGKTA